MVTTKKMMADLNKLTGGDKFVCDACGSDKITEKVWVDVNNYIVLSGETYCKFNTEVNDESFWCGDCYDLALPITIKEYKEREDAEQKSEGTKDGEKKKKS